MSNLFSLIAAETAPKPDGGGATFFLATVATADSGGITFIPDGQSAATQKKYKTVASGPLPAAGDRVVVMRISGSCLVLGAIGVPDAGGEYVRRTGDSMTGSLNLDSEALEIDSPPASSIAGTQLRFRDRNADRVTALQPVFLANGSVGFELIASRPINGSNVSNFIRMTEDSSGNAGIYISHPTAWLDALGTVSYTETASEICEANSAEFMVRTAKYAQWGRLASIWIQGTALEAHTNEYVNLFTMVGGKRPKLDTDARAWRNINAILYANGIMEYYGTWTANQNFTFICTYLLA